VSTPEKLLEKTGKQGIELAPGDRFAIRVPLRLSTAVNLGRAEIDVTLAPDAKHEESQEDIHLVGRMDVASLLVARGNQTILLHGVVPAFSAKRNGAYHPSDFSTHFGSGNVTNIGTPDNNLIDTESLTKELEGLHLKLTRGTR
jgi:hypothetical protein